jgi:hypothetical protein
MKNVILFLAVVFVCFPAFSQCEDDVTNPWFLNFNPEPTISCSDELSSVIPITQDDCDTLVEIAFYDEIITGECPGNYDVFRVYRAFDDNGNQVVEPQLIHIVDETGPTVTEFTNLIEVSCGDEFSVIPPQFSDECSGIVDTQSNIETFVSQSGLDEYVYIWSATDGCNNSTYVQTTVRYVDTVYPWFVNFPSDMTINCQDEIPEVVYPLVFDNCDSDINIEYTEEIIFGDCPSNFDIVRVFRAYDNSGNPIMETQTIHVVDNTSPEFNNLTTDIISVCEYTEFSTPIVWDNCGDISLSWQEITVDSISPCNYSRLINWTATDQCGNSSFASQVIQIIDTISPIIIGQIEIDLPSGSNLDSVMVDYSDNCSGVSINYSDLEVSGNNIIRTYTVTDGCGNTSIFEQIIGFTIQDTSLVAICHQEGNGSYHTIWVSPQAVQAHLNHGDYLGECQDSDDGDDNEDDDGDDNEDDDGDTSGRVAICHQTGNGSYHTIWVAPQAVQAHLNHGDYLGPCQETLIFDWRYIFPEANYQMKVVLDENRNYVKFVRFLK